MIGVMEIVLFVLPVVADNSTLDLYTVEEVQQALLLEAIFILFFVGVWLAVVARGTRPVERALVIPPRLLRSGALDRAWLVGFGAAMAFTVANSAGWLAPLLQALPRGAYSLLRTVVMTAGLGSVFFLALGIGARRLRGGAAAVFAAGFCLYLLAQGTDLLLSSALAFVLAVIVGFAMGRGTMPWLLVLGVLALLQVLHAGKAEMRDRYWYDRRDEPVVVTPARYASFYAEWVGLGVRELARGGDSADGAPSILDRASLIQMVLYAQERAPEYVPYLNGRTIALVPPLLVPRFLWPDKPRTHEGQIILNTHFGRQTLEETERTYISWGLLAEFYANFGRVGAALLGVFLGVVTAVFTRLSIGVPMGSYRFALSAVVFVSMIGATQMALSVLVTSTFQALVAITLACLLIMRPVRLGLPEAEVGPLGDEAAVTEQCA
jgi:hypothetical protein